jgi:hypothetical protein
MFHAPRKPLSFRSMTLGAAALGGAAIIYAIAASGCFTPTDAIIRGCLDAGAHDAGDAGAGGAPFNPDDCT